ncbi:Asp-tRNA(Asn)/Glu-tRNA(Gln) amidotransferase subunit GatA [Peribacillus saganii]|uniref:Asp-tRNA(Asn)/Glu-tRNA(Gln) amidotransferase subunit GatA n=1 Tax=Peribacillus saganii TaxID=2303992 RepID=A0A372LM07_9BACI|nr:amidase [Peribacillus saganii]RFU68122.1 Asp-tRNA(Asn)/Glu-tRNA(Gln) amidotransferase subunit GatA [Peribacillus saganii]
MKTTQKELLTFSIARLSELIKKKKISPTEVAIQLLKRINEIDPKINSFITIDKEEVLEQAKRADQEIENGNYKGPLHGVPIGLKDLIYTQSLKTTMGSEIYQNYVPDYNATVVEKLKEAGAIIVGKLNTHQFAYGPTGDRSFFGPVRNPHNTQKMTGGSSSGSAAAVSACLAYGSLGTDTGASIRVPASFCGIVGMKPTYGLVSKHGVFPLSMTLDHVGPLTRTVTDNAILLNVIAGFDQNDPNSIQKESQDFSRDIGKGIEGMKIGIPTSFYFDDIDEEVRHAVEKAIEVMRELGAVIQSINLPNIEKISESHKVILKSEAYAVHEQHLKDYPDNWDDEVKERLLTALDTKGYEYVQALQIRKLAKNEFNHVLEDVDVILTPTLPILPPKINERHVNIEKYIGQHIRWSITKLTAPTNLNGLPSLSVPCGFSADDMPIGIQLIGREFDEATLYRFGYALEQKLAINTAKYAINERS